jgi:hypothetical protein
MAPIGHLLAKLFNHDFAALGDKADFHQVFFDAALDIDLLAEVFALVNSSEIEIDGQRIPSSIRIPGRNKNSAPFVILAQLHGNEPAGLAGIALAMALAQAGKLEHDVIGVIGNPLAAAQYFADWAQNPGAKQETRDAFRCGVDRAGNLLPDMNRIPVDFRERKDATPHIQRANELYRLGTHASGILDIHSARGNMVCITDHKRDADLKHSPIRAVLTDLAEAISAHSSGEVTVQTLKTLLSPLANIACQVGIEAGRHEAAETPYNAAAFTLALLHTLGITPIAPLYESKDNKFTRYSVRPRLHYIDLHMEEEPEPTDKIFMAKICKSLETIGEHCDRVIVRRKDGSYTQQTILEHIISPVGKLAYCVYQYEEMEAIKKDQVVAVALPSGIELRAPHDFSGIFFSKSGSLYDKDPAVGPWPLTAEQIKATKFCYPCDVSVMKIAL